LPCQHVQERCVNAACINFSHHSPAAVKTTCTDQLRRTPASDSAV
jgi:hypothetical protein